MEVSERFSEHLRLVDEQPLTGAMKIWLYQHYILACLSWPFLIYDFSIPFAKDMQKAATRFLKRWLRINQKAIVLSSIAPVRTKVFSSAPFPLA